jgi:hypothetical protein
MKTERKGVRRNRRCHEMPAAGIIKKHGGIHKHQNKKNKYVCKYVAGTKK